MRLPLIAALAVACSLLTLAALVLATHARADCLQWVCSKDKTQCMCIVTQRPREDKIIPDRFNPWPPEFDDRYGNPRRRN